jgi:uncharacterized membrane protein YjjP (DUF1212 family)
MPASFRPPADPQHPEKAMTASEDSETTAKTDLIARAARALHASGTPADRLERALQNLSQKLGLAGQFFSTPTSLMMSLRSARGVETRLERLEPGTLNLSVLSSLDEWLTGIVPGTALDPASDSLAVIETARARFGRVASALGGALVTAAAAGIFGGSGLDVALAAVLGLVVGVITAACAHADASNRLAEITSAAIVAFVSASFAGDLVSPTVVVVSSLIPLFPGLSLTIAIREIAARHLVSGASRFAGTLVVFLTLGAGAAIGSRAASWAFGSSIPAVASVSVMLSPWFLVPALVASAIGLGVTFQARPRDFPWILVGAALALAGTELAIPALGPELGTSATSFALGIAGNLFARRFDRTSSLLHVPGLVLLVPGTIGFRSVSALTQQETVVGIQAAFSVLTIGLSLVMGLLLASALVPSRRAL